ncbi:contactin-5-like [Gigantopelta aegis]|uniref:contactin-5-like n=1 Tax=Gigantopelta aegis TaxID=1735272 RepID=UPI001B887837|nr:contactin-5-like [Gigantopelta aegis]XP_041361602.1 contactin-5-like [Gigantopelta aegis]XP_041361603.1 contactin-5-like [Gigantopelta aegis]XP_041361604.1 contactin-5-like [Gigantopelta aegis]
MTTRLLTCFVCFCLVASQGPIVSPPNIQEPKADKTRYVIGKVEIYCKALGNPKPTYVWLRDGQEIEKDGQFIRYDPVTGTVTIPNFTSREEGAFTCLAMNTINQEVIKSISPEIKLVMQKINKWGDKTPSAPILRHPGDYAALSCDNAPISTPPGTFKWYRDDRGSEIHTDDRLFIDAEGTLHFAFVRLDDDLGDKPYKCALYNHPLDRIYLGGPKILKVTELTPGGIIPQSKPVIVYQTSGALGKIRSTIELECTFSGYPVPIGSNIKWYDNSKKEIQENNKFKWEDPTRRRILKITDLQESDEGTYSCTGRNMLGKASTQIFLNVTSGPIWVRRMVSVTRPEGQDVEFPCLTRPAMGERELDTPVWYKNGQQIPIQNSDKFQFSDLNRVLTVKNINKKTDIMCLQCLVKNEIGRAFGDGCLNVVLPITINERPPEKQEILKGDVVQLTVRASTEEGVDLQYQWFFNNTKYDINPPDHVTYDPLTLEAFINTSVLTDEQYRKINGTYIREVFYDFDRINVTTEVILKELPVIGPVATAQQDLWWIALIIALIILIVVIIIICIVCYRKKQEGVYPLDKKERASDLDPEKDLADSGFHDLSRADPDDDYPSKPKINPDSLDDDQFSDNEDDASLMEYGGDIDPGKFNEDGSFIGQYAPRKPPPPVSYQPNEMGGNIGHSEV